MHGATQARLPILAVGWLALLAGLGGALSGVVVRVWGYPTLRLIAATMSVALGLRASWPPADIPVR